jgi:hypothetical protein
MPLERQTAPSWWGCLCATVCFASQKPSERENFVPARTDSAAKKLLSTLGPGKYYIRDHIQITAVIHLFLGAAFFFYIFLYLVNFMAAPQP